MGAIALVVTVAAVGIVRRTPKATVMPQPRATEAAPANAAPALRPAIAEPVASSPALAVPPVPPASDAAGPAAVKPPSAMRPRASGRYSERPVGRPNGASTSGAPVAPAPQLEKGSMPSPKWKRKNPYEEP